jgi:hypothetical protein
MVLAKFASRNQTLSTKASSKMDSFMGISHFTKHKNILILAHLRTEGKTVTAFFCKKLQTLKQRRVKPGLNKNMKEIGKMTVSYTTRANHRKIIDFSNIFPDFIQNE